MAFRITNARTLSSGDFSSDTAGERLKVKIVNKMSQKRGGYGKCCLDKGRGEKTNKQKTNKTTLTHAKNISKKA